MKNRIFFSGQRGFTLIEVLVSVAILGIISVSVLAFFQQSYDFTKRNESKTVGMNVARNVVNYLEQQNFDRLYQAKGIASLQPGGSVSLQCGDTYQNEPLLPVPEACERIIHPVINNMKYEAQIRLQKYDGKGKNQAEKDQLESGLIPVSVTVVWNDKQTTVRGMLKR